MQLSANQTHSLHPIATHNPSSSKADQIELGNPQFEYIQHYRNEIIFTNDSLQIAVHLQQQKTQLGDALMGDSNCVCRSESATSLLPESLSSAIHAEVGGTPIDERSNGTRV